MVSHLPQPCAMCSPVERCPTGLGSLLAPFPPLHSVLRQVVSPAGSWQRTLQWGIWVSFFNRELPKCVSCPAPMALWEAQPS